jgi:hypothetical protein
MWEVLSNSFYPSRNFRVVVEMVEMTEYAKVKAKT